MIFRDEKLQQHVERVSAVVGGCPPNQAPIIALLDAWYRFRFVEGENCPRVAEAIEHLLSPELRPSLRQWYQGIGNDMDENAVCFRDHLSELAQEEFG